MSDEIPDIRKGPEFPGLRDGGPFQRVRARLKSPRGANVRPDAALCFIAWVPLAASELVRFMFGKGIEPLFLDLSVHARLLVSIPMLLFAERLVATGTNSAISSLYYGRLADRAVLDAIVAEGERWRLAAWPEGVLLALALFNGQLALWEITAPSGVFSGAAPVAGFSFTRVWYTAFALPLANFVLFRWLWRWGIWAWMLWRLSRQKLDLIGTHPDLSAGLVCVSRPLSGYAGFGFACGSILSGAIGTKLLAQRTTVEAELPLMLGFVLVLTAIAIGPLLPFSMHLYRVRRRELALYGNFASDYMRGFHAKWILSKTGGEEALGSSDIQSLADLGNSYAVINRTRFFVFGWRPIVGFSAAALLPMLPIFTSQMSVDEVMKRILSGILGGLPL